MTDESSLRLRRRWLGPVAGLLFFVCVLASAAVFGGFDFFGGVEVEPSNAPQALISSIQAKGDAISTSSIIMLVGLGLLGVFLAELRATANEAGLGWPGEGFLIGGLLVGMAWLVNLALQFAAQVAGDNGHMDSVQTIIDLLWLAFWLFLPGLLVAGIAATAAGLRSSFHPVWLGIIGVATAVTAFVPWDGLFVYIVWVAAASIVGFGRPPLARRT